MITKYIDEFIIWFTVMTKRECDYIEEILNWEPEKKTAFFLAKRLFEKSLEDENKRIFEDESSDEI